MEDSVETNRFLNQTYGVIYNTANSNFKNKNAHKSYKWNNKINSSSTATSPLGFFQSLSLNYGLSNPRKNPRKSH